MSFLYLPEEPDVPWMRILPEGGPSAGAAMQIDASGLEIRNRVYHYQLIENTTDARVLIRWLYKSTLVASDNGFEGAAPRLRGYQTLADGTTRMVVDTNPSAGGKKMWVSQQSSGWKVASFMIDFEDYPDHESIDHYTLEAVVRAASGQFTLGNWECQAHYSKEQAFTTFSDKKTYFSGGLYSVDISPVNAAGEQEIRRYMRDVEQRERFISKGKRLTVNGSCMVRGQMNNNKTSETIGVAIFGYFKMRIAGTGQYDYYELGAVQSSLYAGPRAIEWRLDTEARKDYDLTLLTIGLGHEGSTPPDDQHASELEIFYARTKLIINDFIAPSQG